MNAQEQIRKINLTDVFSNASIWLLILNGRREERKVEGKVAVEDKRT